jgi:tagatose-1,6-bisphosphate aldolase
MTAVPTRTIGGRLDRLATETGQFTILALDHARSFATTIRPHDPDSLTSDEILETKDRLIEGLAAKASAVLVDPALALRRSHLRHARLIVGIEDGDYSADGSSPRLLPGWTVAQAVQLGAEAIKISFFFDPVGDTRAAEQFVMSTARACELAGVPLFCEPLARLPAGSDVRRGVLEGVRRFGSLGAQVLKIQFPAATAAEASRAAWADACAEASELSPIPWALLSEGRDFEEFRELLLIACRAGASGFVAGRVIWGSGGGADREIAAAETRLDELRSIAVEHGQPWRRHSDRRPDANSDHHDGSSVGQRGDPRGELRGGEVL